MATTFISGRFEGIVKAPPSKSAMQRILVAALLADGMSVIRNPSWCDDSLAATEMVKNLGASVVEEGGELIVTGGLRPEARELDCGESGLALRMFTPVAAMTGKPMVLTGRGSLRQRPVDMMERPLASLGAEINTTSGRLPIEVTGPLKGGSVEVDGSVSSQFLTGLLFALPLAGEDSVIHLRNATSRPYIDMTIDILSKFGIIVDNRDYKEFIIRGGQRYKPVLAEVEGDWSGASFFLVMAAISGEITVTGLRTDSLQADRKIMEALQLAGAVADVQEGGITVRRGELEPFTFDITDCPDLAPPLSVLAAACRGKSVIWGTSRLYAKESSRGENIKSNLEKLGVKVRSGPDSIEIEGTGRLNHAVTGSFNDHRMVMAMAAASVLSEEGVTVDEIDCVSKSYPGFHDDFRKAGGNLLLTQE